MRNAWMRKGPMIEKGDTEPLLQQGCVMESGALVCHGMAVTAFRRSEAGKRRIDSQSFEKEE